METMKKSMIEIKSDNIEKLNKYAKEMGIDRTAAANVLIATQLQEIENRKNK